MTTEYNEESGLFTIRNPFFFGLFKHMENISEKDLTINKINELKEQAHKTTFTDDDLDVLYKFACLEFNFDKDRKNFREIPIKNIFKVSNDKLVLNKLVPMAYDYSEKISQGKKPVIQKVVSVTVFQSETTCTPNCDNFHIRLWIFILFIIFLILLLYLCLRHT